MRRPLVVGLAVLAVGVLAQALGVGSLEIGRLAYVHRAGEVSAVRRVLEGHVLLPVPALGAGGLGLVKLGLGLGLVGALGMAWWARKEILEVLREAGKGWRRPGVGWRWGRGAGWWGRGLLALLVGLGLVAGWGAVYVEMGLGLSDARAFRYTDVLFQNDTPRVMDAMAVKTAKQRRTEVHPLFVLMTNPVGWKIFQATGSKFMAACVVNAGAAALGVGVVYLLVLSLTARAAPQTSGATPEKPTNATPEKPTNATPEKPFSAQRPTPRVQGREALVGSEEGQRPFSGVAPGPTSSAPPVPTPRQLASEKTSPASSRPSPSSSSPALPSSSSGPSLSTPRPLGAEKTSPASSRPSPSSSSPAPSAGSSLSNPGPGTAGAAPAPGAAAPIPAASGSGDLGLAVLTSCVLGCSTSQFFFGAIPHTGAMATLTLCLGALAFARSLREGRPGLGVWIVCALLAFGVTITNLLPCLLLLGLAAWSLEGARRAAARVLVVGGATLGLGVVLSLIQRWIYPTAGFFFLPGGFANEAHGNASLLVLNQPITVLAQLLKHLFLVNVVAPLPNVYPEPRIPFPSLTLVSSWNFGPLGWACLAGWLLVLSLTGLETARRVWRREVWTIGLLGCLGFHAAFHCFYGIGEKGRIELLQYTNHWTFLVILLALPALRRLGAWAWLGLAFLAINQAWVLGRITELYFNT